MDLMTPQTVRNGGATRPDHGGSVMVTNSSTAARRREPWNKGKLVGQKAPFKTKDIWAMRMRLQQEHRSRDLALLNLGLDWHDYGTHSMRRTKATLIDRKPKKRRAVQLLLLGHLDIASTVRYLGIGVDDALERRKAADRRRPSA